MRRKYIKPGKVYVGVGGNEREVRKILAKGEIEYQFTKKVGKGRGMLGGIYRCDIQTFCTFAKSIKSIVE